MTKSNYKYLTNDKHKTRIRKRCLDDWQWPIDLSCGRIVSSTVTTNGCSGSCSDGIAIIISLWEHGFSVEQYSWLIFIKSLAWKFWDTNVG